MNLFEGMENFISDTEINIKQKMTCRICFLYRFGGGKLGFGGISISSVTAAGGFAVQANHLEERNAPPVGASPLAMVDNDDAGYLNARVVPAFFASRLAPTERKLMDVHQKENQKKAPQKRGH